MKIRILKSMAGLNFSYSAGQIVERSDEEAQQWVKVGLATPVEEPESTAIEPPEKAVLPRPKKRR